MRDRVEILFALSSHDSLCNELVLHGIRHKKHCTIFSFLLREGQSENPFCPVILSEVEGRAKRLEWMARPEGTRPKKWVSVVNYRGVTPIIDQSQTA